jgi:hypothetical protein
MDNDGVSGAGRGLWVKVQVRMEGRCALLANAVVTACGATCSLGCSSANVAEACARCDHEARRILV